MAKEAENLDVRHATGSNGGRESIEETLGNIWAGVLRVPHVEKHANFFEIGGDSLKAMEVISRVREVLQVDLPLISFFEEPTVVHLAEVLSGQHSELEDSLSEIWAEVLHVQRVERDANFFEIGGDSLRAMDVIARVSDVLHIDLPLVAFFEEPTIRHLADVLSAIQESTADNLAKIWAEILRVSEVERDANFFDIGGDSLKAMEVIARVNEVLKVDLPLIVFSKSPRWTTWLR
jgi:acyl carrier protein